MKGDEMLTQRGCIIEPSSTIDGQRRIPIFKERAHTRVRKEESTGKSLPTPQRENWLYKKQWPWEPFRKAKLLEGPQGCVKICKVLMQ